jgi:hypothetical protein
LEIEDHHSRPVQAKVSEILSQKQTGSDVHACDPSYSGCTGGSQLGKSIRPYLKSKLKAKGQRTCLK